MYKVKVAPETERALINYAVQFAICNGKNTAEKLVLAYENAIDSLKEFPERGSQLFSRLPPGYRAILFWKHLWLVYLINMEEKTVNIDFMLDDRSELGILFK